MCAECVNYKDRGGGGGVHDDLLEAFYKTSINDCCSRSYWHSPGRLKIHLQLWLSSISWCKAAIEKYKFALFTENTVFSIKTTVFSDQKISQNLRKPRSFSSWLFSHFLMASFPQENLPPQPNHMLWLFYSVSWVRCSLSYILILVSEPETQSKTGEMVVKVFEIHSK